MTLRICLYLLLLQSHGEREQQEDFAGIVGDIRAKTRHRHRVHSLRTMPIARTHTSLVSSLGGRSLVARSGNDTWSFEDGQIHGSAQELSSTLTDSFERWAQNYDQWDNVSDAYFQLAPFIEMDHPVAITSHHGSSLVERNGSAAITLEDCQTAGGGKLFKGLRSTPLKSVIDVSIFGADLDVYEMKLHELKDDIDLFVAIEMPWSHKGVPKPLFWKRNKDKPRFAEFKNKNVHVVVDHMPKNLPLSSKPDRSHRDKTEWGYETWQMKDGMRQVREMLQQLFKDNGVAEGDTLMSFGDADEIPLASNVRLMKYCEPNSLPIDNGLWMPMGKLDRAFRTDWPVSSSWPYTFGNPAFHDPMVSYGREYGKSKKYLLGGWHMTDHPFPPFRLFKVLSCTECKTPVEELKNVKEDLDSYFTKVSDNAHWADRYMPVSELAKEQPYQDHPELLQAPKVVSENPERYEAWSGTFDRRLRLPISQ